MQRRRELANVVRTGGVGLVLEKEAPEVEEEVVKAELEPREWTNLQQGGQHATVEGLRTLVLPHARYRLMDGCVSLRSSGWRISVTPQVDFLNRNWEGVPTFCRKQVCLRILVQGNAYTMHIFTIRRHAQYNPHSGGSYTSKNKGKPRS